MTRYTPLPKYDIGQVLEALGADVPGRRGGWVKMRCLIHNDTSPSAAVNFDANRFVCYAGCTDHRGEDAIGLLQLVEGHSVQAAIEEAERITGVSHRNLRGSSPQSSALLSESWAG